MTRKESLAALGMTARRGMPRCGPDGEDRGLKEEDHFVIPTAEGPRNPFESRMMIRKGSLAALGMTVRRRMPRCGGCGVDRDLKEDAHFVIPRAERPGNPFESRTTTRKGSLAALGMTVRGGMPRCGPDGE